MTFIKAVKQAKKSNIIYLINTKLDVVIICNENYEYFNFPKSGSRVLLESALLRSNKWYPCDEQMNILCFSKQLLKFIQTVYKKIWSYK